MRPGNRISRLLFLYASSSSPGSSAALAIARGKRWTRSLMKNHIQKRRHKRNAAYVEMRDGELPLSHILVAINRFACFSSKRLTKRKHHFEKKMQNKTYKISPQAKYKLTLRNNMSPAEKHIFHFYAKFYLRSWDVLFSVSNLDLYRQAVFICIAIFSDSCDV
ncbi:hypothetical protein NPIL_165061 [Nephila pilipes]|uniref:Uncharacterized protein n=1 Tax=Nephila pilipes TaxID=299642 RepID=A0A8X6U4U5_NEPPI|nr:hypothetical protein NPIL_165061 [Nephila pilipes]